MRRPAQRLLPAVTDALAEYLDDIGRYRILSRTEETLLGRRIRAGDMDAVNELVCGNLRFVVYVAKHYQRHGESLLDLIDEGNLGLIRAAHKFDERKGIKFISYAVWWVRQSILHALMDQARLVRMPSRRTANLHRMNRRANVLFQTLGREPSQAEIADELDVSVEEVERTIAMARTHLSLDAPMAGDDNALLEHLVADPNASPDEETFENSRALLVSEALSTLRARDANILRMYFGLNGEEPLTLEGIGSRLGITRERVRQIRDRALRRLRQTMPHLALAG